ncbi:MAG TPA: c-type cytochrome [Prolixibacteraceae bacterium]
MVRNLVALLLIAAFAGCSSSSNSKAITTENVEKGKKLFRSVGCTTCHSVSGEDRYGPHLNAILNTEVVVIHEGVNRTIKVNRDYIQRSIQNPDFEKVIRFQNKKMPKPELSPEEVDYIVDYLISVNQEVAN